MLPDRCPWCDADLTGDPVPDADRAMAGAAHFCRAIGLSDGAAVYAWRCPECGYIWTPAEPPPTRPFYPFMVVVDR